MLHNLLVELCSESSMAGPVAAALAAGGVRPGDVALHVGRHFSIRDLIVWCKRMQVLLPAQVLYLGFRL